MLCTGVLVLLAACSIAAASAQQSVDDNARLRAYDAILDLYVRDGMAYYRTLKGDRSRLDGFVSGLASDPVEKLSRDEQLAFWINAYNAIVLQAIIDRYPIQGRAPEYPPRSIRQIPGVFDRTQHRIAGRMLTLDQIEQTILPTFSDPRVYFALGRGAVGGGRLRSEAYVAGKLQTQLNEAALECLSRTECVQIDRVENKVGVSSIFSWREKEFVAAYADKAPAIFSERSPIERAVLAFVQPKLLQVERDFLAKNQFRVAYLPLDWNLNDLTGRGDR
jgi:hypothetical protein